MGHKALMMRFIMDSWQKIDAVKFWSDEDVEVCRVSNAEATFDFSEACIFIVGSKKFFGVILVLKDK